MILVLLFIGVVLVIAAFRNSQGALFTALYEDVPGFVVWAAAIFAIGAVGFIPGLKPVSRGILALVIVVIVLRNYKNIITGFQNVWTDPPKAAPAGGTAQTNGTSDTASGAGSITGNAGIDNILGSINGIGSVAHSVDNLAGITGAF